MTCALALYGCVVLVAVVAVGVIAVGGIVAIRAVRTILAVSAIAAVASVVAILAVAVIVAILLLRHVDAVDDDAHLRQLALVAQAVDHVEALLRRVVGAANVDGGVGDAANLQRIGHQTHRGGVDDDVVVVLAQLHEDLVEALACHELSGVRWDDAGHEHIEVVVDAR